MADSFKFYAPLKVRFNETDLQGHVNFGQYYFYFDVGVEAYLEAIGYSYLDLLADNTDFVYAESHCVYKASARWPEILHVHTRIAHIGQRSLRFEFEVLAQADGRLVASGYIAAVTVDRASFKPQPVPEGLREAVTAYEAQ
jgi:acyl-CoA thioester hydrolase